MNHVFSSVLTIFVATQVDASDAGEGNLEIFVLPEIDASSGGIPASVEPMGDAVFGVTFKPELPSDHLVYITFNDEPVPGNNINNKKLTLIWDC